MRSLPFENKDYLMACSWWGAHEFGVVPQVCLPKTGLVVYHGDQPVCLGFLYSTDSAISWIEFMVTNPEAGLRSRVEGLDKLIKDLVQIAYEKGAKTIFTSSDNPSLIKKLGDHGFKVGDQNTTQLFHFRGESCQP